MKGADHFTVLAPANELIAKKILREDGSSTISISREEVDRPFEKHP